jgi:hypothetical protein
VLVSEKTPIDEVEVGMGMVVAVGRFSSKSATFVLDSVFFSRLHMPDKA